MAEEASKKPNHTEDHTMAPPSKDSTVPRGESQLKKATSEKKELAPVSLGQRKESTNSKSPIGRRTNPKDKS